MPDVPPIPDPHPGCKTAKLKTNIHPTPRRPRWRVCRISPIVLSQPKMLFNPLAFLLTHLVAGWRVVA